MGGGAIPILSNVSKIWDTIFNAWSVDDKNKSKEWLHYMTKEMNLNMSQNPIFASVNAYVSNVYVICISPLILFSCWNWKQDLLSFKKMYTLLGLSVIVIKWQCIKSMNVSVSYDFASKVSCPLKLKVEILRAIPID